MINYANVPFIKNLSSELLNTIGTYTVKGIEQQDLRLYERKKFNFRDIIDSKFPSLFIIDLERTRAELKKYTDIGRNLQDVLGPSYTGTQKDYQISKLSDKEIDLIIRVISSSANGLAAQAKKENSLELQRKLQTIINTFENESTVLQQVSNLFNQVILLTDLTTTNRYYFLFPTFTSIGDIFTNIININLELVEEVENTTFSFKNLSELLNYGHTAVAYKDGDNYKLQFNSPKLLAIIYDVVNSSNQASDPVKAISSASIKFLEETKQLDLSIDITKDFSEGFMKYFISIGGNVVTFENSIINQRKGSVLETKTKLGLNRVVLQKLSEDFKQLGRTGSTIGRKIGSQTIQGRGSPNALDYIVYSIAETIKGNTVKSFNQTVKNKKTISIKSGKKAPLISGFAVKNKASPLPKLSKPKLNPVEFEADIDLINLQNIINSMLQQQIRKNMGSGNRKDILNYRTGRFSESVEITRLTQGREGVITAYYDYMRYPYATFSAGGRQEFPRSRDPKLLISKSIREIMQQQMITRMRAVLV